MTNEAILREVKEATAVYLDQAGRVSDEELFRHIEDAVLHREGLQLTVDEKRQAMYHIFHAFRGLDILQALVDDAEVTEIMVNDFDEIFVEKTGKVTQHTARFESREQLENLIQKIVGAVNRSVNEKSPIVDARLQDGSRVNVVLPPVALKGPTLTIRKFATRPLTMEDLVHKHSLTQEAADFLLDAVRNKANLFIAGGTGSGKTTFLNALGGAIPPEERIITIEDAAELQIPGIANLVKLEARNANMEGKGEIPIRELIRTSLRMRPDRIIVGEVRGGEALDMLQAMNTGHDGSLSTGHGNSPTDMLSRLETMVLSASALPITAIRRQIASALDLIVYLSRMKDGVRKVTDIQVVEGMRDGEIVLKPLFVLEGERLIRHPTEPRLESDAHRSEEKSA